MGNCLVSYKVMLSLRKGFEAPKYVGTEQCELFVRRKSQAQMKGKLVLFLFILSEKIWQLLKGRSRRVPKTMPWFGSRVGLELHSVCVQVQGTNPEEVAGVAQEETRCRLAPFLASRALEQVGEDSPWHCGGWRRCGCLLEPTPALPLCPVLSSNEEFMFIIGTFISMLSLTCSSRSGANSCDGSVGVKRGFPVCFTGRDDGVRLVLDTSLWASLGFC